MLAFGVIVAARFRLDPHTHAILLDEIEHFRGGARNPTDARHAKVVEDLSGWPYDSLWGNNPVADLIQTSASPVMRSMRPTISLTVIHEVPYFHATVTQSADLRPGDQCRARNKVDQHSLDDTDRPRHRDGNNRRHVETGRQDFG